MKRPTVASLKKVTPENLVNLGVERLAEILVSVAEIRPEVKRRLKMELAAEQGADHLAVEIDRRLATLETSRGKISWRQRPTFVRDLEVVRALIVDRLAALDRGGALSRLWLFMATARRIGTRVRDKHGEAAAVFDRAAGDIGTLVQAAEVADAASRLVEAIAGHSSAWADWLPLVLETAPPSLAGAALTLLSETKGGFPGWVLVARSLADAAGNADAFAATFSPEQLKSAPAAALVAQRLLGAGRTEEAGRLLEGSAPGPASRRPGARPDEIDFDWETAWIDYLDRAGRTDEAQGVRWASFERTLSIERMKAFTRRLPEFEDVEAEGRAFAYAAAYPDFGRGLRFLMDWPAVPEAARMLTARSDEVQASVDEAEAWAARLRTRQPAAAELLLRRIAAAAFRRRDFKTSDRLTKEADAIGA